MNRIPYVAAAWHHHPIDSFWYHINAILGLLDLGYERIPRNILRDLRQLPHKAANLVYQEMIAVGGPGVEKRAKEEARLQYRRMLQYGLQKLPVRLEMHWDRECRLDQDQG